MKTEHKMIAGVVLLSGIFIVGFSFLGEKKEITKQNRLNKPLIGEKIEEMKSPHVKLGERHDPYNSNPPTSGPHWTGVAGPGIKTEFVPDELVLHSLEHGAVVLWYREDIKQENLDILKNIFNEASGKKIMVPRKDMDTMIALTSWGYLLRLESVDSAKIKEFIETNNDRAPEKALI